ncbi:hypothetical protein [Pseudomonas sp. NFACC37-1]|uniref:hypothetical protein n=1 Tax=Pseudomonas sp. NFACC37-1 TaxID=1566196 RepID=UPI0008853E5F|nr:hypothetical protein [Pseudomonas sp. NFACC37-1]SCY01875.1 hypothetical protein SAMN03159391_00819 [Pseudomonas sp. NFACC37-1]
MRRGKPIGNRAVIFWMLATFSVVGDAQAGIFKWIKNEAVPTIQGKRPIVLKEYIKISSGADQIKLGDDSLMIKMGGITVKTGQLRLRLAQGACVWATGDVVTCAPDFIERQIKVLADAAYAGTKPPAVEANSGKPKQKANAVTPSGSGLSFSDLDGRTVQWEPQDNSVGFDFSNPGTASSNPPKPSLFFHDLYTRRAKDASGKPELQILGRADLAFMEGRVGGIACYFATDKSTYILDSQNKYNDPNGYVTIGSKTVPAKQIENVQIQLVIPWADLEVPNTVAPNATMFTQCFLTLDGEQMLQTDWIPF